MKAGVKSDLGGDGGDGMGGIVGDDNVVAQNDDIVLDFLGNALGSGGRYGQPNRLALPYDVACEET